MPIFFNGKLMRHGSIMRSQDVKDAVGDPIDVGSIRNVDFDGDAIAIIDNTDLQLRNELRSQNCKDAAGDLSNVDSIRKVDGDGGTVTGIESKVPEQGSGHSDWVM